MAELSWTGNHGEALRSLRLQRGFTQEALAEAAGVATRTIKKLESASVAPRVSTLELVAKALACSLAELQEGRQIPSIAVLPFQNISGDEEQEPLCIGLAEELINALVQMPGLKVAARTSSFYFKDKDVELGAIGEALGVRHVLEGSVQRSGDRLRITAQLIQIEDGFHIWSERFDRQFTDIFAIEDEIVASVVRRLRSELLGEEAPTVIKVPTKDLVAYELLHKAKYLVMHATPTAFKPALDCAQQAIERDPDFALAHAWIAGAYAYQVAWGLARPRTFLPLARTAAERAVEIDDSIGLACAMLAAVKHILDWDWEGAGELYARALELDPHDALIPQAYGDYLLFTGKPEEAVAVARRAVELDPLSAGAASNLAAFLVLTRQWREVEAAWDRTLSLDPSHALAHVSQGAIRYILTNHEDDTALAQVRKGVALANGHPTVLAVAARTFRRAGLVDDANAILDELKLRIQQGAWASPYFIAQSFAVGSEIEDAFTWLGMALEERDPLLYWIHDDFTLDPLRSDPRYAAIIERMGLTKYVS
jgi:TolB-like protein/Tfp pilus assembly protein PilF